MSKEIARKRKDDPVIAELTDIKKLLIMGLLRNGATQSQVADSLNVNQSSISRMFPKGVGKPPSEK